LFVFVVDDFCVVFGVVVVEVYGYLVCDLVSLLGMDVVDVCVKFIGDWCFVYVCKGVMFEVWCKVDVL